MGSGRWRRQGRHCRSCMGLSAKRFGFRVGALGFRVQGLSGLGELGFRVFSVQGSASYFY